MDKEEIDFKLLDECEEKAQEAFELDIITFDEINAYAKHLYEKTKKVKKEPKEQVAVTAMKYNLGDKTQKDKFLETLYLYL